MDLAGRLKFLREEKKISQRKLAKLLNVAPSTLAMYETGKRRPDYDTLKIIAEYFVVTTDDLIGHAKEPQWVIFGERLRELREAMGISQEDLGRLYGFGKSSIAFWELGIKQPPHQFIIEGLARDFNVNPNYLLGLTDDPTPPQPKQEKPTHEEYVLSAKTLADAAIRIAELFNDDRIDEEEYLRLNGLAVRKFGLQPAKGSGKAAHLENNNPATGVFDEGNK